MNALKNRNFEGVLITLQQTCDLSNMGATMVRKLAEEAGAVRKIGRCYRIHKTKFFDYIERLYG